MRSVEEIVALLGGAEAAAERCGVGTEAIRKWRQSKAIPAKHWPAILAATGLTLADMTSAPTTETPKPEPLPMADTAPLAPPPAWCWLMAASFGAAASGPRARRWPRFASTRA